MRSFISSRVSLTLIAATILLLALIIPASAGTMTGTGSDDNLVGTDSEDKMNGVAGSDQLDGRAQNDSLGGQEGADIINGGAGKDTLNGHGGSDHVRAAPNADTQAMDSIDCGAGTDFLYVESGYTGGALNCEHRRPVSDWSTTKPSWPVKDPDGDDWASDGAFADNCPEEANVDQKDTDGDGTGDACSVVEPPPPPAACADGIDNDGDSLVDLADPGCIDGADNDETNTPPPPQPDGDGDGVTDDVDACPNEAGTASNQGCPIVAPPPASGRLAGAYISGAPWTPSKIDEFNQLTGEQAKFIMWFESWSDNGFIKSNYDAVYARGAVPMVTWNSWNWRNGANQPDYQLQDITAGNYDSYIRTWAQDAAAYKKTIYVRFDHEMNSDWFSWGVCANGNRPADYAAAWRHVHDIFVANGATNVKWVFSPNIRTACSSYATLYPGDAYVDWIALDGYNWGTTQSWSNWQSMGQIFKPSYDELVSVAQNKPVMLAETASTEVGGNKAAWIRQAYLSDIPDSLPKVQAVVWFHENKETDWRVNSSAAALDAYKSVLNDPGYSGTIP